MYTEKKTKNIITKDSIKFELEREDKRSFKTFLCAALVTLPVCGLMFLVFDEFVLSRYDMGGFAWLVYLLVALVCFAPSVICLFIALDSIFGRKSSKRRELLVTVDRVHSKEERTVTRHTGLNQTITIEKVLHFYTHGEVKVNSDCYLMTGEEEEFYIVTYSHNPTVVLKYYPAKMYEYRE